MSLSASPLYALHRSGRKAPLRLDSQGHIQTAIHEPRLPFGSIHTENLTPLFQVDGVYGLNSSLVSYGSSGSGQVTSSDSMMVCQTGATIYSQAQLQSRKRLRYRPGQGVVGRFAARFSDGIANSFQVAGFGHADDGVYFGYRNAEFGILYVTRGVREIRTFTVTTRSTTAENITITLNGVANTVAVTNAANIQLTVLEISRGTYTGWKAQPLGTTVVFVRDAAGVANGTYSITATTAAGTFAQTKAGAASTDTFIAQSGWNGDTLDGSGNQYNPTGFLLSPTRFNVFQVGIQYLGAGCITFFIETHEPDGDSTFTLVHTLRFPGTLDAPSFGNPSFPFTMAVYSAGSTTNLTLRVSSFAGFIEGRKILHGPRFSYFNSSTAIDATNYTALFSVFNPWYNAGANRTNQAVINIISLTCALKHTSPCIIYLIKGGTINGNVSFTNFDASSASNWTTTAHTITTPTGAQILWSGHLGDTGNFDHDFQSIIEELTLQPGEWLTVAAKAITGTPAYVTASLNTREDN